MSDNFFKVKNGLNLPNYTGGSFPTLSNPATGDLVFYNGALYVYNGTAWVVKPGSGLTGLITNADVDATAGIVDTKLATISTAGKVSGTAITSGNISTTGDFTTSGNISTTGTGDITAARILKSLGELQVITNVANPAVYIEQSHSTGQALVVADQASPDSTVTVIDSSGSVGIGVAANASLVEKLTVAGDVKVTTGDIKLDTAKGIESSAAASTLNIGTGTNTTTLNLGTGSSTQTVNIGTGAGVTTINIGGTGDTVVVSGTLTTVNTTNLDVADKNITLNKGGLAGSANGSGISIEAGGSSVASLSFDQTDGSSQPQNTFTLSGTGSLALPAGTTAQRPNTPANGMIRYNSSNGAFEGYASGAWSGIGGGGTIDKITQASHGFVVGDVLYINGGNYAKAQADTAVKAEVVGMVSRVIDASNFELTLNGEVSGLAGLTMGENYFLSASSAGAITATEPSVVGQISLPIGVASSTTTLYVAPKRGSVVGGANLRTQIGLSNAATTTVQNAGSYDAGSIEGWVYIDGTTDYRFHVRAQFAKNGAASDYNLSYQTTGDTPPAGFSVSITSAGLIQVTLPTIAGFVAGGSYINFALNAPAVGATLPLQIASTSVSFDTIQAASAAGISVKNAAGSTTNVFVSDAGNVGIGTTSPGYNLDIGSSSSTSNFTQRTISGASYAAMARYDLSGTGTLTIGFNNSGGVVNNAPTGVASIWMQQAYPLVFGTNGAERGRIDASGAWTLGPASGLTSEHKIQNAAAAGTYLLSCQKNTGADSSSNYYLLFTTNTTQQGYIWNDAAGNIGLGTLSDLSLKENIRPLETGLVKVQQLNPVIYDWKSGSATDSMGFIAQEFEQVFPNAVGEVEGLKGISFGPEFYAVLVKAIQEQQAQIEELKAKLAALENK